MCYWRVKGTQGPEICFNFAIFSTRSFNYYVVLMHIIQLWTLLEVSIRLYRPDWSYSLRQKAEVSMTWSSLSNLILTKTEGGCQNEKYLTLSFRLDYNEPRFTRLMNLINFALANTGNESAVIDFIPSLEVIPKIKVT